MPGGYGPPYRVTCGTGTSPNFGVCYQHGTSSERSVQLWQQVTRVNDWRCGPSGSILESCWGTAQACTPDALYSGTGILPYVRLSDSGHPCTDSTTRCDAAWPDAPYGGSCPGPCSSACMNAPGVIKCNPWDVGTCGYNIGTAPDDYISPSSGTLYYTKEYNTWKEATGTVVDMSKCRKIGFKNVQAAKTWHGRLDYHSHDSGAIKDLYRDLIVGSIACDGSLGTGTTHCNGVNIEFEQDSPSGTKYLIETISIAYNQVVGTVDPGTSTVSRSGTVSRYTGVQTWSCADSGSQAVSAHDLLFGTSFVGDPHYNHPAWNVNSVMSMVGWDITNWNCSSSYNNAAATSGSIVTFTAWTDIPGTGTFTWVDVWADTVTGSYHRHQYNPNGDYSDHNVSIGATGWTHIFQSKSTGCLGTVTTTNWTANGTLTSPYSGSDLNADVVTLLSKWDLADDLTYPWRTDNYCGVAPMVSYNEVHTAITPPVQDCYSDYPTNSMPLTPDPNAGCCNGSVIGAPIPYPGVDKGCFDWKHRTYRGCCATNGSGVSLMATYNYGYGAYSGESNGVDNTDAAVPKTAQRWTENGPVGVLTNCNQGNTECCSYVSLQAGYPPLGGGIGYNSVNTSVPCNYSPGDLPAGAWALYAAGRLYAQKWAEIKVPRPSINFARPCEDDRYALDETTVQCIIGATTGTSHVEVFGTTAINTGDLVWICGCSAVPQGVYQATKLSGTVYSLGTQPAINTSYAYPWDCNSHSGSGIMGKLRYPTAPGICGRIPVIAAYGTVVETGTQTQVVVGSPMRLQAGDYVNISGVTGISINGTGTVTDVKDSLNFIISHDPSGDGTKTLTGPGWVQVGTGSYYWDDDLSKGEFAYAEWQRNERDWQERLRVLDQYTATGSCSDAAPGTTSLIRPYQDGHGMPIDVSAFNVTQMCLPFDVCNPQVMAITPNGETFANGTVVTLPSLPPDERYGAYWQGAFIQHVIDPFYAAEMNGEVYPHVPCATYSGTVCAPSECLWRMDGGQCDLDDCTNDTTISGTRWFPQVPWVEARLTVPSGYPAVPSGVYLGWLTLSDLNTSGSVYGNILPPPTGPGYPCFDAGPTVMPNTNTTPWGIYLEEMLCVCSNGRWRAEYAADGVNVYCGTI